MRYQRLDLNLLIALDVLLAERNVTRAAERMHVTQSTMSGILARLREYFGDQLLLPVGRTMRLTPRAEALIAPVHEIVLRIDAALGVQPEFEAAAAQRHFVLVASDYVSCVMLADVARLLSTTAPGLTFEVHPASDDMLRDLAQARVDFIITPAHLATPNHPQEILFEDTYTVIACRRHPDLKGAITNDQYGDLGHVMFKDEQGTSPWFEQWYVNQYGQTRRVEIITHSFNLIPHFVVGTRRVATIQTRLAKQFARSLDLQLLDPPMATPHLTEVLQWHKLRNTDPAVQWVRQQIVAGARAMGSI